IGFCFCYFHLSIHTRTTTATKCHNAVIVVLLWLISSKSVLLLSLVSHRCSNASKMSLKKRVKSYNYGKPFFYIEDSESQVSAVLLGRSPGSSIYFHSWQCWQNCSFF